MDPLDPLTEIVKSGQAFAPFIQIERFIWLMIGAFFIGAMSTAIRNGMKDQGWFGNKSFLMGFDTNKRKENSENSTDLEDNKVKNQENI